MGKSRPLICLIRSVGDWANNWASWSSPGGSSDSPRPWLRYPQHALRSRPGGTMSYRIAGIDVHKKMLAVVMSDVEIERRYQFERRMFGSSPEQLGSLAAWPLG